MVPSFVIKDHGCINIDERCYNSYLFQKNRIIGKGGFSFDMTTFIYGDQVEDYDVEHLEANYIEGVDYSIIDELLEGEFSAVLLCLKGSGSVKNKIKRRL